MPRKKSSISLAKHAATLTWLAPQVIALRTARMWAAGASPTARDRREMHRMVAEKVRAGQESNLAMGLELWRAQTALAGEFLGAWWQPWARVGLAKKLPNPSGVFYRLTDAGLAPFSRRVRANSKRLGRVR